MTYFTKITKDMIKNPKSYADKLGVIDRRYPEFISFINKYKSHYHSTLVYVYDSKSFTYGDFNNKQRFNAVGYKYLDIKMKNIVGGKLL